MQYQRGRLLFITILCLFILIDETDAFRMRLPGLRISATFHKTATYLKKKLHIDSNKVPIPDGSPTLKVRPPEKNAEF